MFASALLLPKFVSEGAATYHELRKRGTRVMATAKTRKSSHAETILRHWREAVPNDRLAHLIKDATRGLIRALTMRLAEHQVAFGHWAFLRILWETDRLTQRELSLQAGVMEPTTFSAIKAMEKLGYVTRKQMPQSRKNVYVFLTPAGRALKEKLVPLAPACRSCMLRLRTDVLATVTERCPQRSETYRAVVRSRGAKN